MSKHVQRADFEGVAGTVWGTKTLQVSVGPDTCSHTCELRSLEWPKKPSLCDLFAVPFVLRSAVFGLRPTCLHLQAEGGIASVRARLCIGLSVDHLVHIHIQWRVDGWMEKATSGYARAAVLVVEDQQRY
jgi:hypothetical protein